MYSGNYQTSELIRRIHDPQVFDPCFSQKELEAVPETVLNMTVCSAPPEATSPLTPCDKYYAGYREIHEPQAWHKIN